MKINELQVLQVWKNKKRNLVSSFEPPVGHSSIKLWDVFLDTMIQHPFLLQGNTHTFMWLKRESTHTLCTLSEVWYHCTCLAFSPRFLVCCNLLLKLFQVREMKGKKMTNWHVWWTGIPALSNGCSPEEGACFIHEAVLCLCVLESMENNPISKSDILEKRNTPLNFKIRHLVTY